MRELQYITVNSLEEGVGASQVLNYVIRLSDQYKIRLITLEKNSPSTHISSILSNHKVEWLPLPFGRFGFFGGLSRLVRLSKSVKNITTHARGEIPFMAAKLGGVRNIVWDCRALLADQRFSVTSKKNYFEYFVLRFIERVCAKFSDQIVVITEAVIPIIAGRHKIGTDKFSVISTCVDLDRFSPNKDETQNKVHSAENYGKRKTKEFRLLLAGTFGPHYDTALMQSIIEELRKLAKLRVTIALGKGFEFDSSIDSDAVLYLPHEQMHNLIKEHDFGMSIWRDDLGICLKSVAATKNAEFLACGKPIVVNHKQGDIGRIVEQYNIGVATHQSRANQAIEAAQKLLITLEDASVAYRCREVAERYYSLDEGILKLHSIYDKLLN